jgi:hypothetical protein
MGGAKDGGQVSRHPIVLLSELGELTSSKFIIIMWRWIQQKMIA